MTDSDSRQPKVPSVTDLYWPTLETLRALGGSATKQEIDAKVIDDLALTPEQLQILEGDGPHTQATKRLAWARTHLGKVGALTPDGHGLWTLGEKGAAMSAQDVISIPSQLRTLYQIGKRRRPVADRRSAEPAVDDSEAAALVSDDGPVGSENWKDQLLDRLLQISPSAFERLCQRLLKAAGFVTVQVTGRAGDGGIDGVGQYRLALVSFPVVFQSKRYRGSVGPDKVREFRGAMAGRGDKGLLITTGNFTPDASREATREGVPQIDLIDGDRLCDLLLEHRLGAQAITTVAVDEAFLQTLDGTP